MAYDVTPTGPKGFALTATPFAGAVPHIVGDFASLVEAFADVMRDWMLASLTTRPERHCPDAFWAAASVRHR
jgi:hypothetical protein